jgi:tetratricopeptide (TPR) repeat protein
MVAAEIAVTFDEDLADAHKTLGFALSFTGREEAALTEYERAVELNPNHNAAVNNIGVIHAGVGRHAEALRWYKRAFPLDPNNVLSRLNVGFAYAALGEYDIARTWFDQAARLTPGDPSVALYNWFVDVMDGGAEQANRRLQTAIQRMNEIEPRILGALAEGAFYAGDAQSALRYSDEALEGVPEGGTLNGFGDLRVAKAWGLTREGMTGEALEILNRVGEAARALLDEGSEAWGTLYIAAQVEALRGSREDALALLVRSLEHGLPYQALDQDPIFDDYRGDSRYVSARRRAEERVGLMRAEIAAEERAAGERP